MLATAILACIAILGPALYPSPPMVMNPAHVLQPPSLDFPFGTDQFGRDIFSRSLSGLQISFGVGAASMAIGGLFGAGAGFMAGYFGGLVETVTQRVWDTLMAFPGVLLGVAVATLIGSGAASVIVVAALVNIPFFSRLARQTLVERNKDYIVAAESIGARRWRVARHLLQTVFLRC